VPIRCKNPSRSDPFYVECRDAKYLGLLALFPVRNHRLGAAKHI